MVLDTVIKRHTKGALVFCTHQYVSASNFFPHEYYVVQCKSKGERQSFVRRLLATTSQRAPSKNKNADPGEWEGGRKKASQAW